MNIKAKYFKTVGIIIVIIVFNIFYILKGSMYIDKILKLSFYVNSKFLYYIYFNILDMLPLIFIPLLILLLYIHKRNKYLIEVGYIVVVTQFIINFVNIIITYCYVKNKFNIQPYKIGHTTTVIIMITALAAIYLYINYLLSKKKGIATNNTQI